MSKKMTRVLCGVMVLVLIVGILAMIVPAVKGAETIVYRYGPNNVIYNWGERGQDATSLSPNAVKFYSDNSTSLEELAALSGSSTVASIPSSALFKELRELMTSNHTNINSYNDVRDLAQYTDCMSNGQHPELGNRISSFYSGNPIGPSWDNGSTWNREHTWPNSKGDANGNGENDIMMVRPTASSENGSRGNKAYGETVGTTYYDPNTKSGGTYNLHGDVARIVLYVYVRWQNTSSSDAVLFGGSGVMESKEVLLKWMAEDPVDTWEMGRNDSIESITGTRNVFVDYPELAFTLFGEEVPADMATPSNGDGTGVAPSLPTADQVPETVTAPVAGTAYKMFMNKTNSEQVLFFNGQTESADVSYRLAAIRDASAAVEVYLEDAGNGGYYLYFMNGSTKTYIRIYERTDGEAGKGKGSLELVTEKPAEILTYDSTVNTLVYTADDGENAYYLGTYGTYTTFSVSNTYYITGTNASKVDVEQFPARFCDASFVGNGSTTPSTPTPDTPTPDVPVEPDEPDVPTGSGNYVKISSMSDLTDGQYVMVVSTGYAPGVVDGTWITAVQPTVSGGTVTNAQGGVWTLDVNGDMVTLCDANGVYVGPKGGNNNGIKTGTAYEWKVTCSGGEFTFAGTGEDTVVLASNAAAEYANKFRGYKTATAADAAKYPSTFTLYKDNGQGGGTTPPPVEPDVPDVPDVPAYETTMVTNPVAGTAYKLYMNKTSDGKILYFNGTTESETVTYRLATTENAEEAVDVYLESGNGGYYLYFMNGDIKTYIRIYEREALEAGKGKGSLEFVTEKPAEVLTYNADYNTLALVASADNSYYMGTYSTYTTFSVSNLSYMTADNLDVSQFPAHLGLVEKNETETVKNGWVEENGAWYFYKDGELQKSRWLLDNNKWYWLGADGKMAVNCWREDSKGWVYLGKDGAMLTNAWCTDSQGWCYVGADGYAVTNCWKKDSYGWIWLNSQGSMTKNTWIKDGGKWYFLDANGYMVSNQWRKDSKGWCWLTASGAMATNQWVKDSKGWCYVGADGYCWTNCWAKDSIGWIWLDKEGSMTKSKWIYTGGSWYYLDAQGYMLANTTWNGYHFNASGVCTNP